MRGSRPPQPLGPLVVGLPDATPRLEGVCSAACAPLPQRPLTGCTVARVGPEVPGRLAYIDAYMMLETALMQCSVGCARVTRARAARTGAQQQAAQHGRRRHRCARHLLLGRNGGRRARRGHDRDAEHGHVRGRRRPARLACWARVMLGFAPRAQHGQRRHAACMRVGVRARLGCGGRGAGAAHGPASLSLLQRRARAPGPARNLTSWQLVP